MPEIDLTQRHVVNKIMIAQESFGRFVNDIRPGAYLSMTHVDFSSLDELRLKPLGIYGSKTEITRYLQDRELISHET